MVVTHSRHVVFSYCCRISGSNGSGKNTQNQVASVTADIMQGTRRIKVMEAGFQT